MDDPAEFAASIGLRYVVSGEPPAFTRRRRGKGFSYEGPEGPLPRGHPRREEIVHLAIPPAWKDVWITAHADGHLQATGHDQAARKQYRYHELWSEARRGWREQRLTGFAEALPELRAAVDELLRGADTPSRDVVHAAAVRLLDATAVRVGNPESVERFETRGLTTLTEDQTRVGRRRIRLSFLGKGRVEHDLVVEDPVLAHVLRHTSDVEDEHLLSWRDDEGTGHVTAHSLNAFLRQHAGPTAHAHLFRSWQATVMALDRLRHVAPSDGPGALKAVLEPVAEHLGHTVATCRQYYVHQQLEEAWKAGDLPRLEPVDVPGLDERERLALGFLRAIQG